MATPIDTMMDGVDWEEVSDMTPGFHDGLPYVTHQGDLQIGEISLRCFQLNDGRRIFDTEDIERLLGVVPNAVLSGKPPHDKL